MQHGLGHWMRKTEQAKIPAGMHCKKLELDDNSKIEIEEIQEMLRRKTRMIWNDAVQQKYKAIYICNLNFLVTTLKQEK